MIVLPEVYEHEAGLLHGTSFSLYVDCSSEAPDGEDDRHDFTGCVVYGQLRKIGADGTPTGAALVTFAAGGVATANGSAILVDGVPGVGDLKFWIVLTDEDCDLLPKSGTVGLDVKVRSPAGVEDCVHRLRVAMVKSTTEG